MRKLALALAIGLLTSTGALAVSVQTVVAASPQAKVVIVVGATGSVTPSYRSDADHAATTFAKYTSNIVKVYSPNATWAAVANAAQGASVLVYLGHGSGFPSPYGPSLQPAADNGMGLNSSAGHGDSNTQYYGENYMAQLDLATNAVVLLNHLCYASGDSEMGNGTPTLAVAKQRIDGYASGFLRGNARVVIAEGMGSLSPYIDALFTAHESIDTMWKTYPGFHNHVSVWGSSRNPGFTSQMDPNLDRPQSDGDVYYRSMVSMPGLTIDDVGKAVGYNPATYHPITPVRMLDTRTGNGLSGKLAANTPRTFAVTGRNGIPSAATAVTGNVTVANSNHAGAVYLGPQSIAYPSTSTINFAKGSVIANGVTTALSKTGTLSATFLSSAGFTTDLVFDVTGYFTADTSGDTYHTMTRTRLLDTRVGNGLSGNFVANTPRVFQVATRAGIPAAAKAVTGNVTVVNSTNAWAVYIGPNPVANPSTSTVNFKAGQVQANSLTVALSPTGTLSATYMSNPGNTTHLVFDVTGYYMAGTGGLKYVPMSPARLMDSRFSNGLYGKLPANSPRTFYVANRYGVSPSAAGITGNLTVVNSTGGWAVFVGPTAIAKPSTSTLNFNKGDVKANGLTVALGSGGSLSATYMSTAGNTTNLILDVTGYFIP